MKSFKTILVLFSGTSLIIAGFLGVVVVLDFVSLIEMRELFIRFVIIMGIIGAVSTGILLLQHLNKE
ncbi:hypothetical protein K2Q16_00835 [Patescibacteria group bacterium]|nr:hypothetical protein [Patescibacteria group bacterium]